MAHLSPPKRIMAEVCFEAGVFFPATIPNIIGCCRGGGKSSCNVRTQGELAYWMLQSQGIIYGASCFLQHVLLSMWFACFTHSPFCFPQVLVDFCTFFPVSPLYALVTAFCAHDKRSDSSSSTPCDFTGETFLFCCEADTIY